jgi:hypothetical protein
VFQKELYNGIPNVAVCWANSDKQASVAEGAVDYFTTM